MKFQQADIFLVPLFDGQFGVGQVIVPERQPLCSFTSRKQTRDTAATPIASSEVIAVQRITPAQLADGTWPIIGFEQIPDIATVDRINAIESDPLDAAIAEALMNAWHGLYPWDGFPERDYFDRLLSLNVTRPKSARTKGQLS